jgi:hypothetical protein
MYIYVAVSFRLLELPIGNSVQRVSYDTAEDSKSHQRHRFDAFSPTAEVSGTSNATKLVQLE